ncbi:uncharacterized protein LOC122512728 [Leptopilina heterotoma]|uniref:uncharacterized protein LOC122512728 n=1 Tax=Leptopilina heterotoma TaxID=63436 RepID=UPI001CA8F8E3|nr:uncharacterized protein LOC122512728 [Leptopilina heterotoma]XP_043484695.1 uncharacterized protein LOC122512728 [Leptopilina heterotoma]
MKLKPHKKSIKQRYDFNNEVLGNMDSETIKTKGKHKSKSVSSDTCLLLAAIKGLSVQVEEICSKQDSTLGLIQSLILKNGLSKAKGFVVNNSLNLPFTNMEEFDEFNTKLQEQQFCDDFMSSLYFLIDKELSISMSVLNIMKKYMSKELLLKFTNVKQQGNKFVLNKYGIHKCIVDAVVQTHGGDDKDKGLEKSVIDALGSVISGARDCEGGRKERLLL